MRVFIGSSGEQRRLVDWVTAFMRREFSSLEPVPWTQPWVGGSYTLEHLLRMVDETDAAILFLTPDDSTQYRGTSRLEPRDNVIFEAGLFMAKHGKERTQLLVPKSNAGNPAMPTDIQGVTWNGYEFTDGDLEATGLPHTMRNVCTNLTKLGARPGRKAVVPALRGRSNVEEVLTFVGDWRTISAEGIVELAKEPNVREIDILAAYRVGDIRRGMNEFSTRNGARLRACFANVWDDELLKTYRRKYYDRTEDHIRSALKESINFLLGPCEVDVADGVRIRSVERPPAAAYQIKLTPQRITFGYYRIDKVAFIVPLDMKKAQDPAPVAWVLDADAAPKAFGSYLREFDQTFQEAIGVFPA